MISQSTIQTILGISDKVSTSSRQMADRLNVTFYPSKDRKISDQVKVFSKKLEASFRRLNVNIIPFEYAWENVSLRKRALRFVKYVYLDIKLLFTGGLLKKKEIISFGTIIRLCGARQFKKSISIICLGEVESDNLPMLSIKNFKTNSVINIVDLPNTIDQGTTFIEHFNMSMSLFAHHMANIVIAVNDTKWLLYNFNAAHPMFEIDDSLDEHILNALVPKLHAPISPHIFSEFVIEKMRFQPKDNLHMHFTVEMLNGAKLFAATNLFPKGKTVDELNFRENYHRLVGKLHLDNRNGMSFGFIAIQMPIKKEPLLSMTNFESVYGNKCFVNSDSYVNKEGQIFVILKLMNEYKIIKVPNVWVVTLRSGSNKTNFNPDKDLIKIGLINGQMHIQFSDNADIDDDYKPSFDTKVILAHAVGNAILAEIIADVDPGHPFANNLFKNGMGIVHWHGYFRGHDIPPGVIAYGSGNPHVSCSSPQSAIYALDGKINSFFDIIDKPEISQFLGDIHVEPHHGINMSYPTITGLAKYIIDNPGSTELGNRYLNE